MPVSRLVEEMPYEEFLKWSAYFEQRPVEWRDDLRTAQIMRAFGDKRLPQEMFPSVAAIFAKRNTSPAESIMNSRIFHRMLSAKGGDKLSFMESYGKN